MSRVQICRMREGNISALPLPHEIRKIFEDVNKRAFELFQQRGSTVGHDLDDWLQAEREALWAPPAELIETEKQFKLRIAVPGYEATDVKVTAYPNSIIVSAEAEKEARTKDGRVHISELNSRRLFRHLNVPSTIDVEKVTASLDRGVLRLLAGKSERVNEPAQAASSRASA